MSSRARDGRSGAGMGGQQAGQENTPASTDRSQVTILNVNNNDANRRTLTNTLAQAGFQVLEATTGKEALRLVGSKPDLIVLEVELPDVDGFEVCKRIKADPASSAIPILHLSTRFARDQDRADAQDSGADGYLVEPMEPPELLATVRGLLRLRQAEQAALDKAQRIEQLEKELRVLERLTRPTSTAATARAFGNFPLRESHPRLFHELVRDYEGLMDMAMEQQQFRVMHNIPDRLGALSDRLGFLRAGPRDVVDVYATALKAKSAAAPPAKARAYVEEGRLLVLELMGNLLSYYRTASLGVGRDGRHTPHAADTQRGPP